MAESEKNGGVAEDGAGSTLAVVRELLSRSVMLPRDILRETLDDAVRRGRITREDAEELVERLAGLGRQQADEILALLESQVSRARRAAGLGSAFPIDAYDDLTAAQVTSRLDDLSPPQLRNVRDYERRNANRKSVLSAVEKRLA
jgi:hypothetical protein